MPRVSVIIPARDAAATLPATLAALAAQRYDGDHEVIVVDDASTDATAALAEAVDGVRVIRHPVARGPAAARSAGAAAATADVLAFTDADCRPTEGWLEAGSRALRDADLAQGAVHALPGVPLGPFDRTLWVTRAWGLFESANLFVTRATYERAGGFTAGLGQQQTGKELGEDVAFGWRAIRSGARARFAPDALVHHEVFPRRARGFIAERERLRYFPSLAARVPELRERLFFARIFLNRRTAAFDLATVGVLAAALTGRRRPLVALGPYVVLVARDAARWGARGAPRVAIAGVVADGVGAAALARGSLEARTPLL